MLHPILKWAQRTDKIFVELHLMDITNEKVQLTSTHLTFQGQCGGKKYGFTIELLNQVVMEESKWNKTGFHMLFVLQKKNTSDKFWPRLIKSAVKSQYIQVDWTKWVDEDEQLQDPNKGLGGVDPSQMQNFGGDFGAQDQDDQQGNIDDLQKQQDVQEKKQASSNPSS